MARVALWVKPGARRSGLAWDPWRNRWTVSCPEAPSGGAANRAVAARIAEWLSVPSASVRWEKAGTSRAKILEVDGLTDLEIGQRLHRAATRVRTERGPGDRQTG